MISRAIDEGVPLRPLKGASSRASRTGRACAGSWRAVDAGWGR